MVFTIDRELRDVLHEIVMLDLDAIHDIVIAADTGRIEKAQELRRRFEAETRLLDDLGWAVQDARERFEIALPPEILAVIIDGLHRQYLDALVRLAEGDTEEEAGTAEENAAALAAIARMAMAALESVGAGHEEATASPWHG